MVDWWWIPIAAWTGAGVAIFAMACLIAGSDSEYDDPARFTDPEREGK